MPKIFMSYRRADSISATGRLHEHLVNTFGAQNVFKDVDDIPPGVDFREHLKQSIIQCEVVLVMIGHKWVNVTGNDGQRRLEKPDDWVRNEVALALANPGTTVIPVLVEGAPPPMAEQLPEDIRDLAYRNAYALRNDPDFIPDTRKLIDHISSTTGMSPASKPKPARKIPLTAILATIVVVFAVLFLIGTLTDNQDTPATPDENEAALVGGVREYDRYTNEDIGYTLEIPADWQLVADASEVDGWGEEFIAESPDYTLMMYAYWFPVEADDPEAALVAFIDTWIDAEYELLDDGSEYLTFDAVLPVEDLEENIIQRGVVVIDDEQAVILSIESVDPTLSHEDLETEFAHLYSSFDVGE